MNRRTLFYCCFWFMAFFVQCPATANPTANIIPTNEEHPFIMEYGVLTGSRASFKEDHHIDWMNNGDYATYELENIVDASYYTVSFTAGTTQPKVTLNFSIKNADGVSVCNHDVEIENNNDWSSTARSYDFRTNEMLKGTYTMVITFKSVGGNGTTANVNNISFTPKEKFVSQRLTNEHVSLVFPFNLGTDEQTAVFETGTESYYKSSGFTYGENLTLKGTSMSQTLFQPKVSNESGPNSGNAIDLFFYPKKGLKFTPEKASFVTTRYGTDGGKVDVSWILSDGSSSKLATAIIPARNNATPNVTEWAGDISGIPASGGLCGLRLHLYALGNSKQVGFGNIVIEGTLDGETEDATPCKLTVIVPPEAGKCSITPNADVFDEGDQVTVSTTENFGYHFNSWCDASGQLISTDNPYTFTITSDTELYAVFDKKETYALDLTLTGGALSQLVSVEPAGTFINGRRMYETGTDVKLTAHNNKILTFIGWENYSTDPVRMICMDEDHQVTADFSACDYIVGWDFYQDQPAQERAADYRSDSENAGILSLHNANGQTSSWLSRGVNNGSENGRWAARIWKMRSEGLYFEIAFSSVGYSNLKLSNGLGVGYNTYSINNVEYSIDGVNYTKIGTFNLTGSGWFDKEFELPAEADNQQRVYIRWMPDRTSKLVGNATDYDGLAITDIFVTADASAMVDEEAVLVNSNPLDNGTDAPANGSIILTFDKKVVVGEGAATLAGEELTPIISGKTAIFQYNGLQYGTHYSFIMPEGVLTSRSGKPVAATTIEFTTMHRTQPAAHLYDAIVAQDGSGDYRTVQAAVNAAPSNRAKPWLIFIKNGQYKEHVDIPANKPYLHLIGQDRDKTIIRDDRLSGGDNAVHVSVGATVVVNANNTFIENLTMENIWGHEKQSGPQALALNTGGDRIAMNHVRLLSYQDTWITTSTSNNRHYIRHSLIEGAVDFIYNSGNVYLDGDTLEINRPSGGFIVAPSHGLDVKWGYVFQNCIIRPYPGMKVSDIWLGRPWHNSPKTVYINTQTFVNIPAKGWYETMGGLPVLWADYNTVDANGDPVDLSQRRDTYYYTDSNGNRVYGTAKNFLTPEEAAQYTVKNVMGGTDNWQPEKLCEACEAPQPVMDETHIQWEAVPYAICYVVTRDGEVVSITTDTSYPMADSGTYYVQAVNEYGGLSPKGYASTVGINQPKQQGHTTSGKKTYAIDGRSLSHPFRGINIVRQDDGTVYKSINK